MDKNSICSHKNVHNLVTVNYWPLVDTVSYSIQTCWLLQFLLKPVVTSYIYSSDPTFISRWKSTQSSLGYKVHEMNSNESFLTLILVSRMLRFDSSNHYKNYTRVLCQSLFLVKYHCWICCLLLDQCIMLITQSYMVL